MYLHAHAVKVVSVSQQDVAALGVSHGRLWEAGWAGMYQNETWREVEPNKFHHQVG